MTHGTAVIPLVGSGSPVGSVTPDYVGQPYFDDSGSGAQYNSTGLANTDWVLVGGGGGGQTPATLIISSAVGGSLYNDGQAFVVGTGPPTAPLTVVMGVNDTFVFTPAGTGTPETFTVAPGTYTTDLDVLNAMAAALGEFSDPFNTVCDPTWNGTLLVVYAQTPSPDHNGDTLTTGPTDVLTSLGFTSPATFAGAGTNLPASLKETIQFNYDATAAAYGVVQNATTSAPTTVAEGQPVAGGIYGDIDVELFKIDTTNFAFTVNWKLLVTNVAGTESLMLVNTGTAPVAGPNQNLDVNAVGATATILVGSDLSWDGINLQVLSAAGGVFVVSLQTDASYS